ncbi:MAG: hypothetical protein ACM3U2_16505, partial [Deltaproteobacteria bacterium]
MRTIQIVFSAVFAGHVLACSAARGDDTRDIDRLVFVGVESFDVVQIRQVLEKDFDLLLAAEPGSDERAYLKKLKETLQNGYWYSGFPEARVDVGYSSDGRRIEVHVQEGPRYRNGDIRVAAAKTVKPETIIRALTEQPLEYRNLWKAGRPSRFDAQSAKEIRREVEHQYAATGCFSPDFETRIDRDAGTKTATLVVVVRDEGPHSVIGKIKVRGSKREWQADVVKYLDLRPGLPFDNGTTARL